MEDLYNYVNPLNKRHSPMISKETLDIVLDNKAVSHIQYYIILLLYKFSLQLCFAFLNIMSFIFAAPQLCNHFRQRLFLQFLWF